MQQMGPDYYTSCVFISISVNLALGVPFLSVTWKKKIEFPILQSFTRLYANLNKIAKNATTNYPLYLGVGS
jgi:hypothetical protein